MFTKFGLGEDSETPAKSAHAGQVLAECDASLRRLGVDAIDLYQLHWPVEQPIPETAAACAELLKAGKIRAIGVSNYSVAQLEEWRATGVPLHSVQSPYSLLRPAIAPDVLPFCAEARRRRDRLLAAVPRHAVRDVEEGQDVPPRATRAATHKDYQGARFERHLDAIARFASSPPTAASACRSSRVGVLLHTPGLTGCIVGARSARQGAMIASLGVAVTDDQVAAVERIMASLRDDLAALDQAAAASAARA